MNYQREFIICGPDNKQLVRVSSYTHLEFVRTVGKALNEHFKTACAFIVDPLRAFDRGHITRANLEVYLSTYEKVNITVREIR